MVSKDRVNIVDFGLVYRIEWRARIVMMTASKACRSATISLQLSRGLLEAVGRSNLTARA